MNIKQSKEQIKNIMTAYFTKDEMGNFAVPIEQQRPVFLMGPPGIGKTAIMEQVANELGVGLVSYSMTHHTRQSAIGLPYIEQKTYGGKEYSVSEYTMSEIIASVYDMIETTGLKEGILFLDEVNCVSETLAPAMLQFLQYKIFGRHRVPDGWLIVTAGNPPEYNNSVREFDIVTWDRLLRLDIEPDFDVWKEYAYKKLTHPSIMTYLEASQKDFYYVQDGVDGKTFVTARGWSDLSTMINLYEQHGLIVDLSLISQFIQNQQIAKNFAVYYELCKKYNSDYKIVEILDGNITDEIRQRAQNADFRERLTVVGLLISALTERIESFNQCEVAMQKLLPCVQQVVVGISRGENICSAIESVIAKLNKEIEIGKVSQTLSQRDRLILQKTAGILSDALSVFSADTTKGIADIKKIVEGHLKQNKKQADKIKGMLSHVFIFCEEVFDERERIIFVTELTANYYTVNFISHYGCDEYYRNNKQLLFFERQKDILSQLDEIFD